MTNNKTINFDPVVLNSRDVLVAPGSSQLLTVSSADPKNQTMHYSWKIDGTPVGSDNPSYTFTNNEPSPQFKKFTAKVNVYNLVDTSSISWNMFDSPLVISSTPVTQVNPGDNYSYQVESFNFNRDALTYLLVSPTPNWLSVDPNTGL